MNKRDVLDGWKEIANYLGKSVKTIQRWEKNSDFPVQRVPGRRSVFAFRHDIDEWMKLKSGNHADDSPEYPEKETAVPVRRRWDFLFQSRAVIPVVLILITVALGLLAAKSLSGSEGSSPVLGPLAAEIVPYSSGSVLTVKNGYGIVALNITFEQDWCKFALHTPGTRMWQISDVNRDGLDDFVLYNPESKLLGVNIYLQDAAGILRLDRKLEIHEKITYQGQQFHMEKIQYIDLADLDGDGVPELGVTTQNNYLYPAMLIVMTLKGDRILTVAHPGWFRNFRVETVNGGPEIFAAGTNNFIAKYSEPILFCVKMDWHRRNVRFSLLRPGREMAKTVPKGVELTYARLGDFPNLPGVSVWEPAVIRPKRWGALFQHLVVEAAYCDSRKGKFQFPGDSPLQEVRQFEFRDDMVLLNAQYNDLVVDALKIPIEEKSYRSLLVPHYWNGQGWQERVCTVPQGDVLLCSNFLL